MRVRVSNQKEEYEIEINTANIEDPNLLEDLANCRREIPKICDDDRICECKKLGKAGILSVTKKEIQEADGTIWLRETALKLLEERDTFRGAAELLANKLKHLKKIFYLYR